MYEAFYGLSADPFRLSPDHRYCFYHPSYKKARAYMRYSLTRAEGFVMVTGRPGTGKTTLINDLLASLDTTEVSVARLATTQLQGEDFLRAVGYAFGIDSQGLDQATLLRDIERYLQTLHQGGRSALLVVDEAQDLRPSALTELRLLANIQCGSELLMQAFLIGQEQLAPLMGRAEMEQFRQRIIAACHLQPLTLTEVRSYVEHRVNCAGWKGDPSIEGRAFHHIHRFSQGIPRQVNMVCSRLFLHGCVEELHRITAEDALSVIEELNRECLGPSALREAEPIWPPLTGSYSQPRQSRPKAGLRDAGSVQESLSTPVHTPARREPLINLSAMLRDCRKIKFLTFGSMRIFIYR